MSNALGFSVVVFVIGLLVYYIDMIFKLLDSNFKSKKQFWLAIIPFFMWGFKLKESYNNITED